jgi:hypothetical protein
MTILNISTDIPTQINTLERLAMWSIMALRRTNPSLAVVEVADQTAEKVAQTAIVQADDGEIRFIGRVSIKVSADYAEDNSTKLWTKALEFSNTVLPAAYKTN